MALAADEREALRTLAGSPNGCTESVILTHGFAIGMLHGLVRDGLATAERRTARGAAAHSSQVDDDYRRRAAGLAE